MALFPSVPLTRLLIGYALYAGIPLLEESEDGTNLEGVEDPFDTILASRPILPVVRVLWSLTGCIFLYTRLNTCT
jgi:hypothetical protein